MEVLSLNYKIFILLWIFPQPEEKNRWIKARNILIGLGGPTVNFFAFVFNFAFVYKNFSIDLEKSLYSMFHLTAQALAVYIVIIGHLTWRRILKIFTELKEIHGRSTSIEIRFCAFQTLRLLPQFVELFLR